MLTYYLVVGLAFTWALILLGGWLDWHLLRQNGRLLLRLEELERRLDEFEFGRGEESAGLPVGSEAPSFELPDLAGERRSLAQHWGQPLLLIFFNPVCSFCRELVPKLATLTGPADTLSHPTGERRSDGAPLPLVITTGDPEANRRIFAEHKLNDLVLLQKDGEVAKAYQANGTPTGYLIDAEGKIASKLAMGAEALLALANGDPHPQPLSHPMGENGQGPGEGDRADRFRNRSLARSKIKRDGLKAGTHAPEFRLPRLDGRGELTLSELRGKRVLLVFSSPTCGPCNILAPELEKFHREHPEVEVVMIGKGEPKENRAKVKEHGLTFPIVLQQQWEISRRYALFATPVAYLINEHGVIHYDPAVGSEAIRELLAAQAGAAELAAGPD